MSYFTFRGLILLFCVGILASEPYRVCSLRSKNLALRWDKKEEKSALPGSFRSLKDVATEDLQTKMELAPSPSMMTFDPDQSNKRTVRKGSDPIHNRW
ncbi:hypothetical protein K1719_031531 [Acacia pycnantha]|nr:hypothetical protein K1719_031531 [Acacia pycnantha]